MFLDSWWLSRKSNAFLSHGDDFTNDPVDYSLNFVDAAYVSVTTTTLPHTNAGFTRLARISLRLFHCHWATDIPVDLYSLSYVLSGTGYLPGTRVDGKLSSLQFRKVSLIDELRWLQPIHETIRRKTEKYAWIVFWSGFDSLGVTGEHCYSVSLRLCKHILHRTLVSIYFSALAILFPSINMH